MASLDTRVILAGQPINVLGQLGGAAQAAALVNGVRRDNALADLYKTQGAGILAGDQGALNALAAHDPAAALGIRQTQGAMRVTEAQLAKIRQDTKFAMEDRIAQKGAAAAAAEAQEMQKVVQMALAAQDQAQFDRVLSGFNPELVGKVAWEDRDVLGAYFLDGVADAFEMAQGPEEPAAMQTLRLRAAEAGLEPGTDEYKDFMRTLGKSDTPLIDQSVNLSGFGESTYESKITPEGVQGAYGLLDTAANLASDAADSVGYGTLRPEVQAAQTEIGEKNTSAMLTLVEGYAGRPSNLTREQVQKMLPEPGTMGNDKALSKARNTRDLIRAQVIEAGQALKSGSLTDAARSDATQFIISATRLHDFYDDLVNKLEGAGGGEIPTITDKAGYDALPSGAQYIHPDGTTRVKK